MKKSKKLIIVIVLSAICLIVFLLTVCGESYIDKEIGDFVVRFYNDCCAIKGTTAQGNEKKVLVIPEYIEGSPVVYLGIQRTSLIGGKIGRPEIESDKLEKVFFESGILAYSAAFSHCPNLTKTLFIKGEDGILSALDGNFYYSYKNYVNNYSHIEHYYNNGFWKIPANVSYYYNYENADNNGYYWIDDYDYGGKIDFIPKGPSREGYAFGGWYKEPECINKWDFDHDTLPKEKTVMEEIYKDGEYVLAEVTAYQETILYAKWI